jgi:hypothetical protein
MTALTSAAERSLQTSTLGGGGGALAGATPFGAAGGVVAAAAPDGEAAEVEEVDAVDAASCGAFWQAVVARSAAAAATTATKTRERGVRCRFMRDLLFCGF